MKRHVILLSDIKESIVSNGEWETSDDYSLFHITPTRSMSHKGIFDGCSFIDLSIDHKTEWGAPIPSTFQKFFGEVLELIIPEGYILILNIVDLYEGYFEQDRFVEDFVKPNNYDYFYIDKEINGKVVTTLFFECPIHRLSFLDETAFSGTDLCSIDQRWDYFPHGRRWGIRTPCSETFSETIILLSGYGGITTGCLLLQINSTSHSLRKPCMIRRLTKRSATTLILLHEEMLSSAWLCPLGDPRRMGTITQFTLEWKPRTIEV